MKILLFLLLFSLNLQAQQKTWLHGIVMQSDWYTKDSAFLYFQAQVNDKYVDCKIKALNEPILSPVFFVCKNGKFAVHVERINPNGFYIIRLFLRQQEQWLSIDSGLETVRFYTGKRWYIIPVKSNLKTLKTYCNENR
jgi:hypothetical protein